MGADVCSKMEFDWGISQHGGLCSFGIISCTKVNMCMINIATFPACKSMGLQWERMAEAVREQERNLRGLVRLQYPQQEDYPSLPADLYGEQDAREAQQRAEIVLDWVRGMLPGKTITYWKNKSRVFLFFFFIVVWSRLFKCSTLL